MKADEKDKEFLKAVNKKKKEKEMKLVEDDLVPLVH